MSLHCIVNLHRLDTSHSFLPDVESHTDGATASQLCGMITQSCGGADAWWRNPGFSVGLQQDTDITIVVNQPNLKVLGLSSEQHDVELGFRVLMDVQMGATDTTDVVDPLDPQRRSLPTPIPTVPDFIDHLFSGLSEPVPIPISESKLAFVIAHVPC